MVAAPAAADAIARARRYPDLGVGLHLVLVEGRPMLPPDRVPDLVDTAGTFRTDMVRAAVDIFIKARVRKQLAAEITAQFSAFADSGLKLDHVNAHKHFHLHPTIASHVIEIGARFGMKALRVPREPSGVIAKIDPARKVAGLGPWGALLRRRLRPHGLVSADWTFGNTWSGALSADRLTGLISNLPDGVSEIYGHPATSARFDGAAAGYRYEDELAALTSAAVSQALRERRIVTTTFAAVVRA
jgi:hopanoid biosynthesis associated protein HpnK